MATLVAMVGTWSSLEACDFSWSVSLAQGTGIQSMLGVYRLSIDGRCRTASSHGIPALALFPGNTPTLKSECDDEALSPENLIDRAVRQR